MSQAIEQELAAELGVTVEELEVVEDSQQAGCEALLPDGFEWGGAY